MHLAVTSWESVHHLEGVLMCHIQRQRLPQNLFEDIPSPQEVSICYWEDVKREKMLSKSHSPILGGFSSRSRNGAGWRTPPYSSTVTMIQPNGDPHNSPPKENLKVIDRKDNAMELKTSEFFRWKFLDINWTGPCWFSFLVYPLGFSPQFSIKYLQDKSWH